MRCPNCDAARPTVFQTRDHRQSVHRIRRCRACRHKFATIEFVSGVSGASPELSPEEKSTIRRLFARILTVLGISTEK